MTNVVLESVHKHIPAASTIVCPLGALASQKTGVKQLLVAFQRVNKAIRERISDGRLQEVSKSKT